MFGFLAIGKQSASECDFQHTSSAVEIIQRLFRLPSLSSKERGMMPVLRPASIKQLQGWRSLFFAVMDQV